MKKVLTLFIAFTLVFTLAGCGDKIVQEDVDNVADATQKLSLDVPDVLTVTADIDLQATGLHDTVITWESSDTAVITTDGVVTRPAIGAGDANVTLTATITLNDEVLTKEFPVKVLESVPTSSVTIAVLNSDAVAVDDTVEITGIVVGTIIGKGFHIYDGTGFSYVYQGIEPIYDLGDQVTVVGTKIIYFNLIEVSNVTSVVLVDTGNALPAFLPTTIADINLEDNEDSDIYNTQVEITGVVELVGAYNNVYINWVDADFNTVSVEVYYKSGSPEKIAELVALEGKLVTVEAILMDFHTTEGWRISVNTNSTITEVSMTDLQKAQSAAGILELGDTTAVTMNMDLPMTGEYMSTVSWASSDVLIVENDGTIHGIADATQTVTLTATVTVGTDTSVKTFEVTVEEAALIPITVAAALAMADDDEVLVYGVISGFYSGKPMIQDEDGTAIFIYAGIEAEVGDKVVIAGTLDTYESWGTVQRQLGDATLDSIVSSENDVFVFDTYLVDDIFTDYPANSSQRITLSDVVIDVLDDGYGYTFIASGDENFKFKSPVYFDTLFAEGDTISQITFNVVDLNYSNVRVSQVVFGGLTAAEKMIAAKMVVDAPAAAVEDITLITELPDFDATIRWDSLDENVINNMGEVSRPANGDGDASIVLFAYVTIGEVTESVMFIVEVAERTIPTPDLFISEYIEGSGNNKALEIFNPTAGEIDLSNYSILMEGSSAGPVTYDFTGTLASGEVFVICNDNVDNDAALVAECDVTLAYPSVSHFNGNDTVALLKAGKVIDQFGVPADAGGDDFAKDVTLVRNATVAWGNEVFDITEWTEFATDTFTDIGMHTSDYPMAVPAGLFFSEYGEPDGGVCKYVEIYNPTDATIDLTGWTISSPDEGDTFDTDYRVDVLTGEILAGQTIVIVAADCIDGSDAGSFDAGFPQSGITTIVSSGNAVAYFNGDDAVGLFNGDVLVDVIGFESSVKDTMFTVGTGDDNTQNVVLVRIPSVTHGELDWAVGSLQWTVKDDRDYTDVGTHTID